jgi:hypothetical protein
MQTLLYFGINFGAKSKQANRQPMKKRLNKSSSISKMTFEKNAKVIVKKPHKLLLCKSKRYFVPNPHPQVHQTSSGLFFDRKLKRAKYLGTKGKVPTPIT